MLLPGPVAISNSLVYTIESSSPACEQIGPSYLHTAEMIALADRLLRNDRDLPGRRDKLNLLRRLHCLLKTSEDSILI